MISISFTDGFVYKFITGITPIEIACKIDKNLAKKILSVQVNGIKTELLTPIYKNSFLEFFTWDDRNGKKAFWHSSLHLLAQSILFFYPNSKGIIGFTIDEGFYYDIDFGKKFLSKRNIKNIENKILYNARKSSIFKKYSLKKEKAFFFYKKNKYKTKLIKNLKNSKINFCKHDNFIDLCFDTHISNTSFIKEVKILNISEIYWKGKNKITRIYCISFPEKEFLKKYIFYIKKAKKRDHRKLGKKLNIFTFSKKVGLGLPLWLPMGTFLKKQLKKFLNDTQKKWGYNFISSPHIGHKNLYINSGHWSKYKKNNFKSILTPNNEEEFLLKPMNCPHHCEIYRLQKWSYKDLPVRFAEFGTVYRYEKSGELHGLLRVRGFTQDDAHIFCRIDQIVEEIKKIIDLVCYIFNILGFLKYNVQISLRDIDNSVKYIGSKKNWEKAEKDIKKAVKEKNINPTFKYGEAAFYGPKLDFIVKDILGRNWQLGTIQIDYNLPERFNLRYKGYDNNWHIPILIHRAPFGSLERFIAILIEHTAGELPFWLTPIQIIFLPISKNNILYTKKIVNLISDHGFRIFLDKRNEKIEKKIRDAEMKKIPLMVIIGDKEQNLQKLSIREHKKGNIGIFTLSNFLIFIKKKNYY
jgi:threonyl-tRNA synthetase